MSEIPAPFGRALLLALCVLAACDGADELAGPEPPADALRFVDLDVGYAHACALTANGRVYCWGGNSTGVLGDGSHDASSRPVQVTGALGFVDVDAGAAHACGVEADGTARCWGHNDEGQLGDGSFAPRIAPTSVAGGHAFVAISAGHAHTCALEADGDAWCWGDDSVGQLGDGGPEEQTRVNVPVRVQFAGDFIDVRAGFYQTCGLDESGAAWCWGSNVAGQNGDGTDSTRHAPIAVQGGHSFRSIAPGELFVCGVERDDDVFCWGANRRGELGEAPTTERRAPFDTGVDGELVSASSGEHTVGGARAYACAIRTTDRAVCWGGSVPLLRLESPMPAPLDDDLRFRFVAAAPRFVCGLRVDGYAYCGGANSSGALGVGDGLERDRMTPVVGPH